MLPGQPTDEGRGGQVDADADWKQRCTGRSTWSQRPLLDAFSRGQRPHPNSVPLCAV